jgi:hypothetical protein
MCKVTAQIINLSGLGVGGLISKDELTCSLSFSKAVAVDIPGDLYGLGYIQDGDAEGNGHGRMIMKAVGPCLKPVGSEMVGSKIDGLIPMS